MDPTPEPRRGFGWRGKRGNVQASLGMPAPMALRAMRLKKPKSRRGKRRPRCRGRGKAKQHKKQPKDPERKPATLQKPGVTTDTDRATMGGPLTHGHRITRSSPKASKDATSAKVPCHDGWLDAMRPAPGRARVSETKPPAPSPSLHSNRRLTKGAIGSGGQF